MAAARRPGTNRRGLVDVAARVGRPCATARRPRSRRRSFQGSTSRVAGVIDTHCHVHDRKFDDDRDEVVARARAAGVNAMVTVGGDIDDSRTRDRDCATIRDSGRGRHPSARSEGRARRRCERAASAARRAGRRRDRRDRTRLLLRPQPARRPSGTFFARRLRLARETALPVVFHQRDAFEDFIAHPARRMASGMRGVVHCFTGNAAAGAQRSSTSSASCSGSAAC